MSSSLNIDDAYDHNESDLCDLEQVFRSLIEKHISAERKLKETHLRMQEITLAKLEIERILANQTRELTEARLQLKLMQSTMQQWELDRSNQRETSAKQWIQVESLTNERDLLLENVKKLQIENMKMKMTMEENEKQELDQKNFDNLMKSHKLSMNSIFEKIHKQNQNLESEQNALKKNFLIAKNIGQHMIQLLKQHHQALNEAYAENTKLKDACISLSSKINSWGKNDISCPNLKTNDANTDENALEKHLKKCDSTMKTLTDRVSKEVEEKMKLSDLLKKTLQEQDKLCEREQYFKTRLSEFEKTIEFYREKQDRLPIVNVSVQTEVE